MPTGYTSLLGLALPVTGELDGAWGDTVNNSLTNLVDSAIAGTTTLSTDADVTLSSTQLAANEARQIILLCTGNRTTQRVITAPARSKVYIVINLTTASVGGPYSVKIVGSGPTTGVTVNNSKYAVVAWNGSDFVQVAGNDLTAMTGTLPVANGGTGTTTSTGSGAVVLATSPTLTTPVIASIVNTGTLTLPTSTDTLVGRATTDTLTNKRLTPRVSSTASISSPLTPNSDNFDQYCATAQAGNLTLNADSGTPTNGQTLIFRFKDDGTPRTLTWTTGVSNGYRAIGVPLPVTTVASKTLYVGCIYNSADSRWDVVGYAQES